MVSEAVLSCFQISGHLTLNISACLQACSKNLYGIVVVVQVSQLCLSGDAPFALTGQQGTLPQPQ